MKTWRVMLELRNQLMDNLSRSFLPHLPSFLPSSPSFLPQLGGGLTTCIFWDLSSLQTGNHTITCLVIRVQFISIMTGTDSTSVCTLTYMTTSSFTISTIIYLYNIKLISTISNLSLST